MAIPSGVIHNTNETKSQSDCSRGVGEIDVEPRPMMTETENEQDFVHGYRNSLGDDTESMSDVLDIKDVAGAEEEILNIPNNKAFA
jgi:hypothetical protein